MNLLIQTVFSSRAKGKCVGLPAFVVQRLGVTGFFFVVEKLKDFKHL